jgi:hypothetical protein
MHSVFLIILFFLIILGVYYCRLCVGLKIDEWLKIIFTQVYLREFIKINNFLKRK